MRFEIKDLAIAILLMLLSGGFAYNLSAQTSGTRAAKPRPAPTAAPGNGVGGSNGSGSARSRDQA